MTDPLTGHFTGRKNRHEAVSAAAWRSLHYRTNRKVSCWTKLTSIIRYSRVLYHNSEHVSEKNEQSKHCDISGTDRNSELSVFHDLCLLVYDVRDLPGTVIPV